MMMMIFKVKALLIIFDYTSKNYFKALYYSRISQLLLPFDFSHF